MLFFGLCSLLVTAQNPTGTTYLHWYDFENNGKFSKESGGQTIQRGTIKGGQRDGLFTYYRNGQKYLETTFENNLPVKDIYYDNGKAYKEVPYINGLREGRVKTFSNEGVLIAIENYVADKYHGEIIHYSENGIIERSAIYEKGERQSEKQFYENGELKNTFSYRNGEMDGKANFYFDNGQLMMKVVFREDKLQDVLQAFHKDGSKNTAITFKEGNGRVIFYYDEDKPFISLNFSDYKYDGEQQRYNSNGKLLIRENYKNGVVWGEVEIYNYDGELKMQGMVENGMKTGNWTELNYKGEIEKNKYKAKDERKYVPEEILRFYGYFGDIFTVVPNMPEFEGGMNGLGEFLRSNIKYPEKEKKNNIEGVSYVMFVVNERGDLENIKIYPGTESKGTENMHKESIRVISMMQPWTPGFLSNGRPVRVSYSIPIRYKLK